MAKIKWRGPSEWNEWSEILCAVLHGRNKWRLPILLTGILFATGRRTVSTWLRAAGVSDDYEDYYYFLSSVGRNTKLVALNLLGLLLRILRLPPRLLLVIDDTPTKRYGPQVEGADVHHNPTPGPADHKFLYGHVWVTLALAVRHPLWGSLGLPLQALLYVRRKTMSSIPAHRQWVFKTKLELAVQLVTWFLPLLKHAKKQIWLVADGAYAKRPFLRPLIRAGVVIVSRLRNDAALYTLPKVPKRGARKRRGRRRIYGTERISLAKRAGQAGAWQTIDCTMYGQVETKTYKTFLATYPPAGGCIRVVLVKENAGWIAFFCTDPTATVEQILEAFADRATIEQCFHDQKEIWQTGKQQVRNIWSNVAAFNLNLWVHTLVEMWAWNFSHGQLCDRSASPWDDPDRRPSHADRRKALRQTFIQRELSQLCTGKPLARKFLAFARRLANLAA
jgi:hypothetical protein